MENLNEEKVEPSLPHQSWPEQNSNRTLYNVAFAFMIVSMVGVGICALYFIILAASARTLTNHLGVDTGVVDTGVRLLRTVYVIAAVLSLISYAWNIPFIIKIRKGMKTCERPSTAFGVCVLIFGNLISGILLLVMSPNKPETRVSSPE